jgi:O-antigen/teichoic acid export membrane protein
MTTARRIISNTLATYLKFFVFALTGLFAVPVVLKTLGAVDYGIFSVIGGCLAFLMFLNMSLAAAAQRHIAYALGESGEAEAAKWFTTSLIVHVIVAASIAVSALLASHWVLHHLLTIPEARLNAAVWIYRMVVATMMCNVLATPYQALLIAHESIASMSLMNTGSGVFLLIAVFCLKYLPGDALLWYAAIYCLFQASVYLGPVCYCYYRYPGSRFSSLSLQDSRRRLKELWSFSGWSLLIILSMLVRVQGPAVVLNVFFGPIANAAYGLVAQVQGFANNIIWAFLGAATPSIVKRQASGDYRGMAHLSNQSNTYGFAILWIVLAPILFEMRLCLRLWLHTVPPNTAAFLMPVLIALIIDQLTLAYNASLIATGRIAAFSLVISIANAIGVPAGYFLTRAGKPGAWILWAIVLGTVVAGCARLWFARVGAGILITDWLADVLLPTCLSVIGSIAGVLLLIHFLADGLARLALVAAVNCGVVCLVMWFLAMNVEQRSRVKVLAVSLPVRLLVKPAVRTRGTAGETP